MRWFKEHWSKEHLEWITVAKELVAELYHEYNRRYGNEVARLPSSASDALEMSEFD